MKNRLALSALCLAALPLFFLSCGNVQKETYYALGTICSVTIYNEEFHRERAALFSALNARLVEIERCMSTNDAQSGLSRVNSAAGKEAVAVEPELAALISRALEFSRESGGAFNPLIGPLVKLWGIGSEETEPRLPSDGEIAAALSLVGAPDERSVVIDTEHGTVYLTHEGMALDLGGIAKGYACDCLVEMLRDAGVTRAIVDLGGNIFALGRKSRAKEWKVGIRDPAAGPGEYRIVVHVSNAAVVTSGGYERFVEIGGKRYHHILSPVTGFPIDNALASVTIIAPDSADADALSTACFVQGYPAALPLVEKRRDTFAIFIFADGSVAMSAGAEALIAQ